MLDFIRANDTLFWWLGAASLVMFLGTLLALPFMVAMIPADYFTHDQRRPPPFADHHPVIRMVLLIAKNILGGVFSLAGIAMLILPGQGLLTILIGLLLIDFPGKFALERWLIRRKAILKSINWLRAKRRKEPLRMLTAKGHGDHGESFASPVKTGHR